MIRLVSGFLNTEKSKNCDCASEYRLPIKIGDIIWFLVSDNVGSSFNYNLVFDARFANPLFTQYFDGSSIAYRIYTLQVVAYTPVGRRGINFTSTTPALIEDYCGAPMSNYCSIPLEELCFPSIFGTTCFVPAGCDEQVFKWTVNVANNNLNLSQRLPVRLQNPQAKVDGIKTYQKSNGQVLRTGRARAYYEYALETDYMPELFHRQLLETLILRKNLIVNDKEVDFGGDYRIDFNRLSCKHRASCKMIEKAGIFPC